MTTLLSKWRVHRVSRRYLESQVAEWRKAHVRWSAEKLKLEAERDAARKVPDRDEMVQKLCLALHLEAGRPLDFYIVGRMVDEYQALARDITRPDNPPVMASF